MKARAHNRRRLLAARRRPGEQGLTLIELLLSIALLAILTGFVAGGLQVARRGFEADRSGEAASETFGAIQTLSSLVGSAMPVRASAGSQAQGVVFDGRREGLSFVGLSEGHGLQGGLHKVVVRRVGSDLVADFSPWVPKAGLPTAPTSVSVLPGVRAIRLRYYGNPLPAGAPQWHEEWGHAERLPDLVSIRIEFENDRQGKPITVVAALRQG